MVDDKLDPRVCNLSAHLCRIHGEGKLSNSTRYGAILSLPCPDCLATYGVRELKSRHLGVRISQCLEGHKGNVATCMKCSSKYTSKVLLSMMPVAKRLPHIKVRTNLQLVPEKTTKTYKDANGVMVPYPPGVLVPLPELPTDHPAVWYVTNRGHSVSQLWDKFGASFCTQELPPTKENGVYYKPLINGWRNTPQGRVVFMCTENGSILNWQGRLLEAETVDGDKYILHHDTNEWVHCGKKDEKGNLVWDEKYAGIRKKDWPPTKYKNASGGFALNTLFGFEHLVSYWKTVPRDKRYCVTAEGVLDADRFGAPGIPLTGKVMSPIQANKIKQYCDTCVIAADNDKAGKESVAAIGEVASAAGLHVLVILPPKGVKDFGECHPKLCHKILHLSLESSPFGKGLVPEVVPRVGD